MRCREGKDVDHSLSACVQNMVVGDETFLVVITRMDDREIS